MVELRWIKRFLFLILGLQFTAVAEQTPLYITVRDGDEATLSCKNVMTDKNKCGSTTWLFNGLVNRQTVELINLGQFGENAKAKSDRLSLTADCSLVIKKVTVEDAGQYTCRQFQRTRQQYKDSVVDLSVVSMTEHKDTDKVTLNCSVSTYDWCRHTMKWLYKGRDWDINTSDAKTSQSTCSATALLLTSHFIYTSNYKFLKCEVTDLNSGKVQLHNFSPQLSGEATTTEPETTATQEAVTGQTSPYITVRDGDEVTLSCENVMTDQEKCDSTDWIFSHSRNTAVVLITLGQIDKKAKTKSDRLSVTVDCSLVIKKVTVEDAGYYTCKQYDRSGQKDRDSQVYLSVVSMTEHKDADEVTLSCSVSIYDECRYTVKWVYTGSDLDKNTRDVQMSQPTCSATVVMLTSHFFYTSNYKYLQCEVTDPYSRKVQLYNFNRQLSDVNATPTTTKPTIQSSSKEATTKTPAAPPEPSSVPVWWFLIFVVLAALIVAAVVVAIRRKKTTGNNTQTIQGLSLNPAVTQSGLETSQDTVDPEEGVSYASISFTKKTNSEARVRGDDDEDDDAVTYSTVQASSSSAGASTDPINLYATVN